MKKVRLTAARRYNGLEGKVKRGQSIEVDEDRARELIRAGLAAPEGEQAGPARHQGEKGQPLVTPDDQAKLDAAKQRADEDARLQPYAKGSGWYEFAADEEGGKPVKMQGREAALAELTRREAAGATGQSAAGK